MKAGNKRRLAELFFFADLRQGGQPPQPSHSHRPAASQALSSLCDALIFRESAMGKFKNDSLSHEEIWDDSALVRSWDEAVEEYQVCFAL